MKRPLRPSNFEFLDPDPPRTKRIIEAALTVYVPWEPEQAPVLQRSKIADLARASSPARPHYLGVNC